MYHRLCVAQQQYGILAVANRLRSPSLRVWDTDLRAKVHLYIYFLATRVDAWTQVGAAHIAVDIL